MDEKRTVPDDWSDIVDAMPGGVGIQVDGAFVSVSQELASLLGRETDALVGASWRAAFDGAAADRVATAVEQAHSEGRWEGQVRPVDGRQIALTLGATDAGTLVWTASEASAKASPERESETQLAGEPELASAVLDSIDAAVFTLDKQGRVQHWNRAFQERTGYDRKELLEMPFESLVPTDQHDAVAQLRDGQRTELRLHTATGERIKHEFRATSLSLGTDETVRCVVGYDISDRAADLVRYETILETVVDGVYTLDENLEFTYVNEEMCNIFERPAEELLGTDPRTLFVDDSQLAMAADIRDRVVTGDMTTGTVEAITETGSGERIELESNYRLRREPEDGEFPGSVGIIRDVTERNERERTLERQRDQLATLDRINELLLETARELLATASRSAVERTVCDRLVSSELYQFAWIGAREFDSDRVVPRMVAGEDGGYLDATTITDDPEQGPVGQALQRGEVTVATVDDDGETDGRSAVDRSFASSIAVPLQDSDTVYGVLVVYATHADAFSERTQAGFEVLGRAVGSVIHAANSRDRLFANAVVELDFRITDPEYMFFRAATALDCSLELDGYVPTDDGRYILYISVEGTPPADVVKALQTAERIATARVIRADGDSGRLEIISPTSSLIHTVGRLGGTVTEASADATGVRLRVEVPADADIREVVDHIANAYPEIELAATRERDREVTTVGRPDGVLDALTDRQRETVVAAYRAGYFDWPRESTAEQVAESLGIASPTLHGHLRKAERAILSMLIDGH